MSQIVDRIDKINRALLRRVHPMELGALPLHDVLHDLVDRYRELDPAIDWDVIIDDDVNADDDVIELTVFRVVQEALTNALRHANAKHISVSVVNMPNAIRINLKDDGEGMDTSVQGAGLSGLKDRVATVSGVLKISSAAGSGTELDVTIPRGTL